MEQHILHQLEGKLFVPKDILDEEIDFSEKLEKIAVKKGTCNMFNSSTRGCPMAFLCIPSGELRTCPECGITIKAPKITF